MIGCIGIYDPSAIRIQTSEQNDRKFTMLCKRTIGTSRTQVRGWLKQLYKLVYLVLCAWKLSRIDLCFLWVLGHSLQGFLRMFFPTRRLSMDFPACLLHMAVHLVVVAPRFLISISTSPITTILIFTLIGIAWHKRGAVFLYMHLSSAVHHFLPTFL